MSTPFEQLVEGIVRTVILGLVAVAFISMLMYWLVWNNARLTLGKAMDEIEDRMDKIGYIERNYAERMLDTYCDSEAFDGYTFTVVEPGFDTRASYIGQPMYIEVKLNCNAGLMDFTVTGRADAYNRGDYSGGYNTPNQH